MPISNDSSKNYIWGKRKNKVLIIVIIIAVVLVVAFTVGYLFFGKNINVNTNSATIVNKEGELLTERKIDGVLVPTNQSNFFPVAVMIENLVSARPQSGLSEANLIYEALAEGGITRFMVVYAGSVHLSEIGPVRSARSYYLDWAKELNAMYVHIGGSPQALSLIPEYKIFDLNQFSNAPYFWRSKDRPGPHNLYISSANIAYALRDKNAPKEGNFEAWKFKDDLVLDSRTSEEKSIAIDFSSFNYKVEYKYDRTNNEYTRYQAGQPHTDKEGHEIKVKNIAIQKMKTYLVDTERLGMDTIGEGQALVFQDGKAIEGTWKKEEREKRTRFYDKNGEEIKFNRGTTWVEVVPSDRDIIYN